MSSKKQRKTKTMKTKKQKRVFRTLFLSSLVLAGIVFLIFFFVSLFDYIYPPATGNKTSVKQTEKLKTTLYFADLNERFLSPELRYIPKRKTDSEQALEIVQTLLQGPHTELIRTFPEGSEVKNVKITKNGTAYVDFNSSLITNHPGSSASEIMTIYSLTNTLTLNIPTIKKVKILVDGKEIPSLKGHLNTKHHFSLLKELIVQN